MSRHFHGQFVTGFGLSSNNHGEVADGNVVTLRRIRRNGREYSSVSAECLRFRLRCRLVEMLGADFVNRTWNEFTRANEWKPGRMFSPEDYIDDDVFGFMQTTSREEAGKEAEAAEAAEGPKPEEEKGKKKARVAGTCINRKGRLEVGDAISLTPWSGDIMSQFASPGAMRAKGAKTKAGGSMEDSSAPYSLEKDFCAYSWGITLTPEALAKPVRSLDVLRALMTLGPAGGNQSRNRFDFSPPSSVWYLSDDPVQRINGCFKADGETINVDKLIRLVKVGDISPDEVVVIGEIADDEIGQGKALKAAGVKHLFPGVKAGTEYLCKMAAQQLGLAA